MEKITTWIMTNKKTALLIAVVVFAVLFADGSPDFLSGNPDK